MSKNVNIQANFTEEERKELININRNYYKNAALMFGATSLFTGLVWAYKDEIIEKCRNIYENLTKKKEEKE